MSIQSFPGVKISFDNLPSPTETKLSVTQPAPYIPPQCKPYVPPTVQEFPKDSDLNRLPNERLSDPNYKTPDIFAGRMNPWATTPDSFIPPKPFTAAEDFRKAYSKNLEEYQKINQQLKEAQRTELAKEHNMTDNQVNAAIKANEESIVANKKEIWVPSILADEIQSTINHLNTEFDKVMCHNSEHFTNRDKVKYNEKCDAVIAVDPDELTKFIENLKRAAEKAADLTACVPEKPVEVPIHPQKAAIAEPTTPKETEKVEQPHEETMKNAIDNMVETAKENSKDNWKETYGDPTSKEYSTPADAPMFEEDSESEIAKSKLEYMSGNHMLTPDGIDSIMKGNVPVLPAYHIGLSPNDPTVTPDQWHNQMKDIAEINKGFAIPYASPYDPKTVSRFSDEANKFYEAHKQKDTPAPKTEDEFPRCPTITDIPKDLVEMVEKLPNDIWKYNANQNDDGLVLTLTYDVEPRHISITVNTHAEEVLVSTKKDFRGLYNTTLDWSEETAADESIPNTRRLFAWLCQWIKDIMG